MGGVEASVAFEALCRRLLGQSSGLRGSVFTLRLDTFLDELAPIIKTTQAIGGVDLVLIDGSRDYEHVVKDIQLALFAGLGPSGDGRPRFLAFGGSGHAGVRQAILDYENLGLLHILGTLG